MNHLKHKEPNVKIPEVQNYLTNSAGNTTQLRQIPARNVARVFHCRTSLTTQNTVLQVRLSDPFVQYSLRTNLEHA